MMSNENETAICNLFLLPKCWSKDGRIASLVEIISVGGESGEVWKSDLANSKDHAVEANKTNARFGLLALGINGIPHT